MSMPGTIVRAGQSVDLGSVIKILQESASPLESPSHASFRNDPDLVLAAVAARASAMQHASKELRSDATFALEVVTRNWRALEFFSEEVRSDRSVALAAARQNRRALEYASGDLQQDRFFLMALNSSMAAAVPLPVYEGECLRLVGPFNGWSHIDSALRFSRVGGLPPGVVRHRLAARLRQGLLSFQVQSCVHFSACRVYPTGEGQGGGLFALTRGSPSAVAAGWGGSADADGRNFSIVEPAATAVSIYVDVRDGALGSPEVEVWYEAEEPPEAGRRLAGPIVLLREAAPGPGPLSPAAPGPLSPARRSQDRVALWSVRKRALMTDTQLPLFAVRSSRGAALRRGGARAGDAAYCELPEGVPLFGTRGPKGQIEVRWPATDCWALAEELEELRPPSTVSRRSLALAELFWVMHLVRSEVTGQDPLGRCVASSRQLCEEIRHIGIDRNLGLEPCTMEWGKFHTRPGGLGNWEKHGFVMFSDNTIADVTADQFDNVTQLWYPADADRYSLGMGTGGRV